MEYAPDLIPHISPELAAIKDVLHDQLQGLEELLAQRNFFIFQQTTRQYDRVVRNFLRILQQYINVTLTDLFRFIDNVSDLTRIYNQDLETFVYHSTSTLRKVQSCIEEVKAVVGQHAQTIHDLSETASEITDLIQQYEDDANSHSNGAVTARLVSAGLAVTGVAAGAGFAAVVTPFVGIGALFLVSAGGGGISRLISEYDSRKSKIYTEATTKLIRVQGCNNEFQAPIFAIYTKLENNQRLLRNLKQDTSDAATINSPESIRQKSYESAKEEARNIMEVCDQIRGYALAITILKGKLTHRVRQITES
ncbi:hypothetical protein F5H01DRAFT_334899 [Linnemannia elongata]|nr:hypothetical protein F5H01DRAFT_334899 [Linnemannia elongata]